MKMEFSAGGIVYKKEENKTLILVAKHSQHHGWVFPKGLIGDHVENESKEDTATREVEEETGVKGKIVRPLSPIFYWYDFKGQKIKKTVYYFLMEFVSEDRNKRDEEMEEVEWLEIEKVEARLSYKSDKGIWGKVKKYL